ncbi:MAG: hypothetical protein AB7I27_05695 [Bacteriovoracaceae bacterium]
MKKLVFIALFFLPLLLFTNATNNELKISNLQDVARLSALVTKTSQEYSALKRIDPSNTDLQTIIKDFEAWSKVANGSQAISNLKTFMSTLTTRINENKDSLGIAAKLSSDGYEITLTGNNRTQLGQTVQNVKSATKSDAKINVFHEIESPETLGFFDSSRKSGYYLLQDFFINSSVSSDELIGLIVHEGVIHAFNHTINSRRQVLYSGRVEDARKEIIGQLGTYNKGFAIDEVRAWYEDAMRTDINYTKEVSFEKLDARFIQLINEIKHFYGLKNGVELLIGDLLDSNTKFSIPKDHENKIIKNTVRASSPNSVGYYDIYLYDAQNLDLNNSVIKNSLRTELRANLSDLWGNFKAMWNNIDSKKSRAISSYENAFGRISPQSIFDNSKVEKFFQPLTESDNKYLREHGKGPSLFSRLKENNFNRDSKEAENFYRQALVLNNQKGMGQNQVSKITANKEQINIFSTTMYPRATLDNNTKSPNVKTTLDFQTATQKMLICDPGSSWSNLLKEVSDRTKYKTAKEVLEKLQTEFDNVLIDVDLKKTGVLLTDGNKVVSIKKVEVKVGNNSNEYYVDDSIPVMDKIYSKNINDNVKAVVNSEINIKSQLENTDFFSIKLIGGDYLEGKDYISSNISNTSQSDSSTVIVPPNGANGVINLNSSLNVKIYDQVTNSYQGTTFVSVIPNIPVGFKGEAQIVQSFNQSINQTYMNNLVELPKINLGGNQIDPFSAIANNIRLEPEYSSVPDCENCSVVELAKMLGIALKN